MNLKDAPIGTRVFTSERMDDGRGDCEVRETHYIRREDGECRYPHDVKIARVRTIQGDPNAVMLPGDTEEPKPRYDSGEHYCVDPGEADGRVPVLPVAESQFLKAGDLEAAA